MGKPENAVEKYLIRKAGENGFLCYKFVSPGQAGVPDRILIGHGQVIFIELKTETGHPSARQTYVINRMRAAGADVRICYGKKDIDSFFSEAAAWPAAGKGTLNEDDSG